MVEFIYIYIDIYMWFLFSPVKQELGVILSGQKKKKKKKKNSTMNI